MADLPSTLLQVVQSVLSDYGNATVSDISTHPDARRCAQIAKEAFYYLHTTLEWRHVNVYSQLASAADSSKPTHLLFDGQDLASITRLKYNVADTGEDDQHRELTYMYPEDFVDMVQNRSSMDNVDEVTLGTGVSIYVQNDTSPMYWTALDDEYIILDSYDSTIESTVQGNKTTVEAKTVPQWQETDNFVIPVPQKDRAMYLSYVKSVYGSKVYQEVNQIDADQAFKLTAKHRWEEGISGKERRPRKPRYGRRGLFHFASRKTTK